MDRPTDEELKSKLIDFYKGRPRTGTTPSDTDKSPTQPGVKTDAQKILELQMDVGRLIVSVVDLDRVIESQATLINLMVKALTHMNAKIDAKQ